MSEWSELTFLDYQRPSHNHQHASGHGHTKLCICCLEKNVTFVDLTNCKHFGTLKKLCSIKLELGRLVCYHCHAKLKTIYDFKLQAEESFNLLWTRQHSATKRTPKLVKEEMYLECQPQDLETDRIATKSEQNYVNDYKVVVSGCWFNNPPIPPGNETQTDQKVFVVQIKNEVAEDLEVNTDGVDWNSRPRISKISNTATNYHLEVSGLHLDRPQDNEVLSDLDTNDEPLAKIKAEVEIEAPLLQKCEEPGGAVRRQFVNIEDKTTDAVVCTKKGVFPCTECSKQFASKQNLRAHNIKVHNHHEPVVKPKIYKLKDYEGVFKRVTLTHEELMLERETERNSKRYLQRPHRCDFCIVSYNYEQVLNDHNKKHQLIANSFQCDICMIVFKAYHAMKNHERNHYLRYECSVCQKQYISSKDIVDHFNRLHDEAKNKIKYTCSLCDHTSMTYRSHVYHLEKHKGNNLCLLCSNNYPTKVSLKAHMLHMHGKLKERVQCKECDKTFCSQKNLNVHIQSKHAPPSLPVTDTDTNTYYCASCNKFYKTLNSLQGHSKRHSNHVSDG